MSRAGHAHHRLPILGAPDHWTHAAACQDADPEIFFPTTRDGRAQHNRLASMPAKIVCRGCPVRDECLEHALRTNEAGVWGATDEYDRELIRRHNRRERNHR